MCCLLQIFARHSGSFSEGLAIPGRLGGGIPIEVALFRVRTGTSGVATMKLKYLVMLMLVPAVVGVAVPSALAQAPRHRRPLLKCNSQPLLLPTCLLIPRGRVWVSTRVSTKQEKARSIVLILLSPRALAVLLRPRRKQKRTPLLTVDLVV